MANMHNGGGHNTFQTNHLSEIENDAPMCKQGKSRTNVPSRSTELTRAMLCVPDHTHRRRHQQNQVSGRSRHE